MISTEFDRFRFCLSEVGGSTDAANLSAFRERLMLAARPRRVYKLVPFSSDSNNIDCVEPDCELGKTGSVEPTLADVTVELIELVSRCCDCAPAPLRAAVVFNHGWTSAVSVLMVESLVEGCRTGA